LRLEHKDILQANATIIAGILILLTITSSVDTRIPINLPLMFLVAFVLILPFSVSSIFIIREKELQWVKRFTELGLIAVIIYIFVLGFSMMLSPVIRPESTTKISNIFSNNTHDKQNTTQASTVTNSDNILKIQNYANNITITKMNNTTYIIIKGKNPIVIQLSK
jgi:hypothetical protein